ncbi:hypothetical protein J6590_061178 [Homalodisca vitripennis]|nr:hypothetical protein J6590_061178 [Homalodisca vitripennis]
MTEATEREVEKAGDVITVRHGMYIAFLSSARSLTGMTPAITRTAGSETVRYADATLRAACRCTRASRIPRSDLGTCQQSYTISWTGL